MSSVSRFWADWSARDFATLQASGDAARTIAVLPVAATEQHGPHLPLSVDTVLVDGVIAAALPHLSADLKSLILPTQAVGLSPEHTRFAGTLTFSNETILRVLTEMADCAAAAGIRKLVLFNTHGGNVSVMDMVARDLRARLDMLVYSVSWFNLPLIDAQGKDVNDLFAPAEHRFGIHGGDIETSMMLALSPSLVDMSQAREFASTAQTRAEQFAILGNGKSAKLAWQTQDYNLAGAVGNAANATAEKGRAVVDAAGRALAQLLAEVDLLPADTLVNQTKLL
jgi:creatinine amidohydrolase